MMNSAVVLAILVASGVHIDVVNGVRVDNDNDLEVSSAHTVLQEDGRGSTSEDSGWANYYYDMVQLKLKGYREAFCGGKACQKTSDGYPGWHVHNIMDFDGVVAAMKEAPTKQRRGEWVKGNDLGYLILNHHFWKGDGDYEGITLSWPLEQHAYTRPLLEATVGPSAAWNYNEILQDARQFWSRTSVLDTMGTSISKWVAKILHKLHLNLDLTDAELGEFASFQADAVKGVVLPFGATNYVDMNLRKKFLMKYMEAIQNDDRNIFDTNLRTVPLHLDNGQLKNHDDYRWNCNESEWKKTRRCKLRGIAVAMMDSLMFAGGLSVASTIQTGMNLLYSTDFKNDYYDGIDEFRPEGGGIRAEDVEGFMYEVIRLFPGVVGFPWWSKGYTAAKKGESTYTNRTIMNLAMALRDGNKFKPTPVDKFSIMRADEMGKEELHSAMRVAWAGFANEDPSDEGGPAPGSMRRGCPGEDLSRALVKAFFTAFSEVHHNYVVASEGGIKLKDCTPFIASTGAVFHRPILQGAMTYGEDRGRLASKYVYLEPAYGGGPDKLRVYSSKAARMDDPDHGAETWDLEWSWTHSYEAEADSDPTCFKVHNIVSWGWWKGYRRHDWYFCGLSRSVRDKWVAEINKIMAPHNR